MIHDVVLSPFGATMPELLDAARCAEDSGFGGIWTYDHLTGVMLDRGASLDAFVFLGAVAAVTSSVRVGPLVANMMNRHPARLALAMSSLQSLSSGRAVLGLGSGSAPGSRFAGEQETVGIHLLDGEGRSRRLEETIRLVRATWAGANEFHGEFFDVFDPGLGLVEPDPPPIIVGASGPRTIEMAMVHADGVNITAGKKLAGLIELVQGREATTPFETSVHIPVDLEHEMGGSLPDGQLARRVLAWNAPFDLDAMTKIGNALHR